MESERNSLGWIVWASIEGVIKGAKMSGLLELGRTIAAALPGDTVDEKLDALESGPENREVIEMPQVSGKLIGLKRDIFGGNDCCGLPWTKSTQTLLQRYNQQMIPGGGAAHPLHIVLHETHRRLGNIVDIGARNPTTGLIVISSSGLKKTGLDEETARRLLSNYVNVYCMLS